MDDCWKLPVEGALLVLVVAEESLGLMWDKGYLDGWLDGRYEEMKAQRRQRD
jgi:hypothetical protein